MSRKVGQRQTRKTVVVLCEGSTTEPQYIEALSVEPDVRDRAAVSLRLEAADRGEVPLTLVQRAISLKRRALKEGDEIDEIWCAFDVEWPENHPHLKRAVDLAQTHGIRLAVSNPCFEIWLIWHHCAEGRFLTNDEARRLRRSLDRQPGKHLDGPSYMGRREQAVERAARQDRVHSANGTHFPDNNPSSGMYLLVNSVSPDAEPPQASGTEDVRSGRNDGRRARKQ